MGRGLGGRGEGGTPDVVRYVVDRKTKAPLFWRRSRANESRLEINRFNET
jgi:hypothetical protein